VSGELIAAVVAGGVCAVGSPYLARLTLSVPDRDDRTWWRGRAATRSRLEVTAAIGIVLGALAGIAAGWSAVLPALVALALTATPLVVIDYEHHRLPNRLVATMALGAAVLLAVAAVVRGEWHPFVRAIEGAAAVFAVLYLLAFISPRSFGFGDVKLGGVLGAYLGWFGWLHVYYGIFAGFLLGALVAIVLLASRKASLKTALAFGPMLILGALIVMAFDLTPSLVQ
jgi:leader peptidase (prepilin peptidase)/N-methyltransferase